MSRGTWGYTFEEIICDESHEQMELGQQKRNRRDGHRFASHPFCTGTRMRNSRNPCQPLAGETGYREPVQRWRIPRATLQ